MIELTEEEKKLFEKADREIARAEKWAKTHKFTKEELDEMKAFQDRCDAEAWGFAYGFEQARKEQEELEKSKDNDTGTTK